MDVNTIASPSTVLVVDRRRVVRAVLCRHLAGLVERVVEAADGPEGIAAARVGRPDLIIAGAEALSILRADACCRGVPAIALVTDSAVDVAVTGVLGAPASLEAAGTRGLTVLRLPDGRVTASGPVLESVIRALVDEGRDTLILDLARVTEVNTELVGDLVRVISAARGAGMRTAICAPDARVRRGLAQCAETRDTPCEPTRDAVRARLA